MKLGQLVKELQKLEVKHGSDVNVEINIEAESFSFEEDAIAHEVDRSEGWKDYYGEKWVEIYLR